MNNRIYRKTIMISAVLGVSLFSCGGSNSSSDSYSYEYETSPYATPEYFTESEPVTNYCGGCGGGGSIMTYNGPMECYVCHGAGVNITFNARQAYYAECSHHKGCKLFVAESLGSTTCECGCLKSAHVKRYL